jgi:hypothetical protein
MNTLCSDVLVLISTFLCFIDTFALKLVNKKINKSLNNKTPSFHDIIMKRLQKTIGDAARFIAAFRISCYRMSGNFVLECMYGEEWFHPGSSPIEFFRNKDLKHYESFQPYLRNQKLILMHARSTVKIEYGGCIRSDFLQLPLNRIIITSVNNGPLHPSAYAPPRKIAAFIKQFVGFEFCKVMYNGSKLSIFDLDSVFARSCYYNIVIHRQEINDHLVCIRCESNNKQLTAVLQKRIKKYTKRGFKIITTE